MKNFIGSGKKFNDFVVKVSIDVEKATPFIYEFNGKKYLTFDIATKREVDKYGKTHDVSVWTKDSTESPQSTNSGQSAHPFDEPFDGSAIPF
jgi:hypothetical protein